MSVLYKQCCVETAQHFVLRSIVLCTLRAPATTEDTGSRPPPLLGSSDHCSLRCHLPPGRFDRYSDIYRRSYTHLVLVWGFERTARHCTAGMVPSVHWLARALSRNRRGYLCVLGSFLLSLALSLDYSYPNLNTYIVSYLRQNG